MKLLLIFSFQSNIHVFFCCSSAWVAPDKPQLWDQAIEKQNEAQRRGKLLQSALDEADEWQKDFIKKKFSTRRRSSAQPAEKRQDVPASLLSEIKAYRRALDQYMKNQDKEWRDARKKGSSSASDDAGAEPTPNGSIVSPENVLPADTPKRTAKVVANDLLNISASSENFSKTARAKQKSPARKAGKAAPKQAKSIASSSSSVPPPASTSTADVVAEMLKTEESDTAGGFENLAVLAESTSTIPVPDTSLPKSARPDSSLPPPVEPASVSVSSTIAPAEDKMDVEIVAPEKRGPGRRKGTGKRGGSNAAAAVAARKGKRSYSSPHGPVSTESAADEIALSGPLSDTPPPPSPAHIDPAVLPEPDDMDVDDDNGADVDGDADGNYEESAFDSAAVAPPKKRRAKTPTIVADGYSDSEPYYQRKKGSASSAPAVAADDLDPSQQNCPMCGTTAHIYREGVVDPTAEAMAIDERPHDRAEDISLGKYMFFMVESHAADLATDQKRFLCPYPHCGSRFSIEFELTHHVSTTHLANLNSKMMMLSPLQQPAMASSSSSSASIPLGYTVTLECDYMGCNSSFPATGEGRTERRRHIESVHLNLHRHICECCGDPVYGSEANERRRQAEMAGVPLKRGRGRPRKYPRPGDSLPLPQPLLGPDGHPIKRGRGRPRKYPRGSHYHHGELSGSELSHDYGRDAPSGGHGGVSSSGRYRRGPGRPRKASNSHMYGGDSSDDDSDMEPSSISNVGAEPSSSRASSRTHGRGRSQRLEALGTGADSNRSRSVSPARRGPGRPRKYPRDEFGHPIKPSSTAGSLGRASKRRKLNSGASVAGSPPPGAVASSPGIANSTTPPNVKSAPSVSPAPASAAAPASVPEDAPVAPTPTRQPPHQSPSPSSPFSSGPNHLKRRGRPPKHPSRHQLNPMDGLTMRQQLKLAAMNAQLENKAAASLEAAAVANKAPADSPRSLLVMSDALILPPTKAKKPPKKPSNGTAPSSSTNNFVPPAAVGPKQPPPFANNGKRLYKEFQDDDDEDMSDAADEDYDDGNAPSRSASKRSAPPRSRIQHQTGSSPAPPQPLHPPSSLLAVSFPIVDTASDEDAEVAASEIVDAATAKEEPTPQSAAGSASDGGGLDLFFGLVDLAASITTTEKQSADVLAALSGGGNNVADPQ